MFRRKDVKIFNVPDWSDTTTKTYDLTTVAGREQVPINLDEVKDICFIYVRENNEYYRLISDTTSGTTRTLVFDGSKTITITKTSTTMSVVFSAGTTDIGVTDTTLTLSGVPADAKATGDVINVVKSDLDNTNEHLEQLDETIYKEVIVENTGSVVVETGEIVRSETHLIDVSIPSGTSFDFVLHANGLIGNYAIYGNNSPIKYACVPETTYHLTASSDITWLSIYVNATNALGNGEVTGVITHTNINENSFEVKIDELEVSVSEIKNIIDADVLFFSKEYEIGANVNNDDSGTTYIYHNFTFSIDGTKMVGVQCSSVIGATATFPAVMSFLNSVGTVTHRINITEDKLIAGFSAIPVDGDVAVRVTLYPSISGGLTTETAKYKNVCIFTSVSGFFSIKKKSIPNQFQLPLYYQNENYLNNKIETIEGLMSSANGNYDSFIFCTDQHWTLNAKQSPNIMNYIYQRLNIPRVFMGGDYENGIDLNVLKAYRDAFPSKIYDVIGNHEYMNYLAMLGETYVSHNITGGDIYAYINMHMTDAISGDFSRGYYYIDNNMQKMRYIVLSVYADNGNSATAQFETSQKTWLQDDALDLPSGYTAVIFAHYLYSVDYSTGAIVPASTTNDILSVVDAYDGNGEIACLIGGHTHVDGMTTTQSGIPVFITTCDKCKSWIDNGIDMEPWLSTNRIEGTITEQAFDVVVINKTNKLISFVRIGAPADNGTEPKLEIRQQNYGA